MSSYSIVYQDEGRQVVFKPATGLTLTLSEVVALAVPDGVSYEITPAQPTPNHIWQSGAWVYVEPPAAPLPPLTARQLRLGLVAASILPSQVDTAIAAIPDDTDRAIAEIEWEYASQFERDHPLIEQVGTALGLTPEQIDGMWQAALAL